MQTKEYILDRLDAFEKLAIDETTLPYTLSAESAWRLRKAEEYPDDTRNLSAAEQLMDLAEGVHAMGEDHPLIVEYYALHEHEEGDSLYGDEAESIKRIGFTNGYDSAEELVGEMVEELRARVMASAE